METLDVGPRTTPVTLGVRRTKRRSFTPTPFTTVISCGAEGALVASSQPGAAITEYVPSESFAKAKAALLSEYVVLLL